MRVNPGQEAEYARRHQPIWPELEDTFREHGVLSYSIFLDPGSLQLFAYLEVESEEKWDLISQTAICRKWWAYMKDLMPCHPDNSPVACEMREVFHIDGGER